MKKTKVPIRFYLDGRLISRPKIFFPDGVKSSGVPMGRAIVMGRPVEISIETTVNLHRIMIKTLRDEEKRELDRRRITFESLSRRFSWKSGSKMWPSDDPNDSPFDTYTCKHCGESFEVRMNGAFHASDSPTKQFMIEASKHVQRCSVSQGVNGSDPQPAWSTIATWRIGF